MVFFDKVERARAKTIFRPIHRIPRFWAKVLPPIPKPPPLIRAEGQSVFWVKVSISESIILKP